MKEKLNCPFSLQNKKSCVISTKPWFTALWYRTSSCIDCHIHITSKTHDIVFVSFQEALHGFTYVPFIVILIISVIFIFFFVPETKNRTFDDIANSIARGRSKKSPFNQEEEVAMGPL